MIKKVQFLFFIMVLMFMFNLCLADIIGNKTDENYTYTSNLSTDIIYTSTMVFTSDYSIQLDTQTATGLTVRSESENFSNWINDTILSINGNVEIDNIHLINNSLLNMPNLIINTSSVTTNYVIYTDTITNNGYLKFANNNYKESESDYYYYDNNSIIKGTGILEISTNVVNSASITQKILSINNDVYFYNLSNIQVSSLTNSGTFINEFENEAGTITAGTVTADKIINTGFINTNIGNIQTANGITNEGFVYITGGINTNEITGSSGTVIFVNTSTVTPSVSTNNANITQYKVGSQGYFYNRDTITAINYNNDGFAYNSGTITVSTWINNGEFRNSIVDSEEIITEGTINADNIINNGIFYFYMTGKENTTAIKMSSETPDGITIFINNSTDTTVVSTNSSSVEQYGVVTWGNFYNQATIAANFYENNGITRNISTITVSTLTNNGSFFTAAENVVLVDTNVLTNNGYFEITGGTNTYKITGSSGVISFGSDENSIVGNINEIQQSTMYVQGIFTNVANIDLDENLFNYGTLINNAEIKAVNYYVNYGTTTNNGKIVSSGIENISDGIFETDINNIEVNSFTNFGKLNLTGNGINNIYIVAVTTTNVLTGTTTITGQIINNNTIAQSYIINEGSITTNYRIYADTITNNGYINLANNTYTEEYDYYYNSSIIEGTGILEISTNVVNFDSITQRQLIINETSFFQTFMDNLNIEEGIINNGLIYSNGGRNTSEITGSSGTIIFNISTTTVSTNSANIEQYEVLSQGEFYNEAEIKANNYENYGLVYSSGTIEVSTLTNNGTFINEFNGSGGTIRAANIVNNYNLITNIDNIYLTSNEIKNNGYLEITGGTNFYKITGSGGITIFNISTTTVSTNSANIEQYEVLSQGEFYNEAEIKANIYENYGLTDSSGIIEVSTFTNFGNFINQSDIISGYFENRVVVDTTTEEIISSSTLQNNGKIEVNNFINYGTVINSSITTSSNIFLNSGNLNNEDTIYSTNYFINYGTTTNTGKITTAEIDNGTGGLFETNINNIEVSSAIINYGNLNLSGDGENKNYIIGEGTTTINGEIVNSNTIAQNCIINEGTITTKLENIYITGKVINNGEMTISKDSKYIYNTNNFEGNGILNISTNIYNTASIQQNSVLISSSSEFYTKADLLEVTNLNNNGVLIFSEESKINKSTITGSGLLYILSDIESTGGIEQYAVVSQNNLTIDGDRFKMRFLVNNGLITLSNGNVNFENTYLQGDGRIAGDVVIGSSSTLSPGTSIGTFYVRGNLTFDNNSTYEVEVTEDDSDYTRAYGNITVNSGSKAELKNLSGKFFEHKTYDILFTTSSLNGEFDEINLSGYDIDVSSTSDLKESRIAFSTQNVNGAMQVLLSRKQTEYSTSSQLTDLSVSQQAVAQAIDVISLKSNKGQIAKLLSELESYYYYNSTYNIEKLKNIFTSLSGTIYANNSMAPFLNAKYEHIYDKIYMTDETKDYVDEYYVEGEEYYETKRNLWGQYFFNSYDIDDSSNCPGYTDSIDGFYIGYDVSSSKNKLIGIVAGYANGKLKQEYDKTDTKSINVGAYGAYNKDKFQLKSLLMLGYDMYKTERQTQATADYVGYNVAFDIQGSYLFKIKEICELKPFVGILTDFITQDSFSEKNADVLNLFVKQNSNLLAQARIGFDIEKKAERFNLYARFAIKQFLTQNYSETKIKISDTGTEFNLKSAELAKTAFNVGLGGEYVLSEYWTAFANIQANIGFENSKDYYGNIGVKYKFGIINREKDYIIR